MASKKLKTILSLLFTAIALIIVCSVGLIYLNTSSIQRYVDNIAVRHSQNRVTVHDKIFLSCIYNVMIYSTRFIYPEASLILKEYLYGNQDTLELSSGYFKKAPFVLDKIRRNKSSVIGPCFIRLNEDRRIAYAVNGFYIRKIVDKKGETYTLYQDIVFSQDCRKRVTTGFYVFDKKVRLNDCLVHAVKKRRNDHMFVIARWKNK
jgi:hypothetical protein